VLAFVVLTRMLTQKLFAKDSVELILRHLDAAQAPLQRLGSCRCRHWMRLAPAALIKGFGLIVWVDDLTCLAFSPAGSSELDLRRCIAVGSQQQWPGRPLFTFATIG
jgi:hypothetical protein